MEPVLKIFVKPLNIQKSDLIALLHTLLFYIQNLIDS